MNESFANERVNWNIVILYLRRKIYKRRIKYG